MDPVGYVYPTSLREYVGPLLEREDSQVIVIGSGRGRVAGCGDDECPDHRPRPPTVSVIRFGPPSCSTLLYLSSSKGTSVGLGWTLDEVSTGGWTRTKERVVGPTRQGLGSTFSGVLSPRVSSQGLVVGKGGGVGVEHEQSLYV